MKTNENQKSTNSQPATQKPFFGAKPEQAFFTAERTPSTPFFQKSSTIQAKSASEETEELNQPAVQRMSAFESEDKDKGQVQRKEESNILNQTGLPDNLKAGVENLSGYSLDDVRVHYNSPKPAQLQALAYTQGTDIHVASGQEEHLPHEAWHVVQQMQGRVKPTLQMKGVQMNDDVGLEREADVMGNTCSERIPDRQENTDDGRKLSSSQQINSVVTQCVSEKKARFNRRLFLTRIIRQDQLNRRNIGIRSVRSSKRSLSRNLLPLKAMGKGKTIGSRIYSYMRKYGGAGIQGFHRQSSQTTRAEVVRGILLKMNEDPKRKTTSRRGKKFVMVVTHQDVLGRERVYDLENKRTRNLVLDGNRKKYVKMYERHKTEGVVAVDGDVSVEEVLAMRAFRGVPDEEELESMLEELFNEAEERLRENLDSDDEYKGKEHQRRKEDEGDDEDPMGGGMGLGQIRDDLVVS